TPEAACADAPDDEEVQEGQHHEPDAWP
ncbi:MAG: hypothetical protein RIQ52_1470, partial [Pseudomonadota bacterium]